MALKQRDVLTNILFWIAMIFIAYFAENVVIFDLSNFQRGFTLIEYVLLFAGIAIILGYYFFNEHKYNGLKAHWLLVSILLFVIISATIGIFLTPGVQYFETVEIIDEVETLVVKEFVTTLADRIKSILFVFIAAVGVYIQVIILPRLISFKRYVLFLMYIVAAVSLVSAFVSYFLDFDSYVHLYQHGLVGYIYPQSFVFNRNMYGLMLMLGMLALYVIISYLPKWYNYVFLIFIFINIFFTFSKASFGIALTTFVVHFIYRMITTFKKSKIRNIIFLVVAGILGICGILLIPFPFFMDVQLFNEARRFILEYYVELGIGSYDGRTEIWDSVISISTGVHLWFGRGLLLFNNTLFFYSGEIAVPSKVALFSHNGFLEILGQWGIVGLIPYCLGILAIFGIDIYVAIKNYKVGIPALIIFGAFLGYTMVETSTLFDLTIEGVTTTALVTLPALSWLYAKRHAEKNREIIASAENVEYKMPKLDTNAFEKKIANYSSLLLGIFSLFAFFVLYKNTASISTYIIYALLILIIFVCLPRTLGSIYELRKQKKAFLFVLSVTIILLIVAGSLTSLMLTNSPLVLIIASKVFVIALLISERFYRMNGPSFKDYLIKVLGKAFVLYIAIAVSGLLVVFLFPGLTLFILSEIVCINIIIALPFVNHIKNNDNKCNDKLLLAFARSIEQ
ncbi:MAG: O-antigen ligase family protein [Bacilli bacterium]|jgi:hypothetical protein